MSERTSLAHPLSREMPIPKQEIVLKAKYLIFALSTLVLVLLDQVSKIWIYNHIKYRGRLPLQDSFFASPVEDKVDRVEIFHSTALSLDFIHAQNPGAAFSMMTGATPVLFIGLALVAMGVLVWQLKGHGDDERFMPLALGMIASGAVGNAIDRVDKGTVTDFLSVYTEIPWILERLDGTVLQGGVWPTFNVADSGIVVGVICFVIYQFFFEDQAVKKAGGPNKETGDLVAGEFDLR